MPATKTQVRRKTPTRASRAKPARRPSSRPVRRARATSGSLTERHQRHSRDTGSTPVQISLLSSEITELIRHLKKHPKDSDSRLGLIKKVGRRRKLLNYLARSDEKTYEKLIADLGLRG